jgi:hypothetical protein
VDVTSLRLPVVFKYAVLSGMWVGARTSNFKLKSLCVQEVSYLLLPLILCMEMRTEMSYKKEAMILFLLMKAN